MHSPPAHCARTSSSCGFIRKRSGSSLAIHGAGVWRPGRARAQRTGPAWATPALDAHGSRRGAQRRARLRRRRRSNDGKGGTRSGVAYVCFSHAVHRVRRESIAEFYQPPAFNRAGAPDTASEDALVAVYEQSLGGKFGTYKQLTFRTGIVLAIWLGLSSALFGRWQRSVLHGVGA